MFQSSISQCGFQISATALPAPESYQAIGWLILTLAGIGGVVLLSLTIIKTVRELRTANAPQKREVTFPTELVLAEDCERKHVRVDKELEALRADVVARDEASKRSRENIHRQLTRLETGMATLEERSKNTDGWLEKVDSKLSGVAEGLANLAGRIK